MLGFHAISEQPFSTIEFIGELSVTFQSIIPIEIQAQVNPNIRTLDWIIQLNNDWTLANNNTVWHIKCQ